MSDIQRKKDISAPNVTKGSSRKKQRIKSKQLLKNIVNDFNNDYNMRGLGDSGHPEEW